MDQKRISYRLKSDIIWIKKEYHMDLKPDIIWIKK